MNWWFETNSKLSCWIKGNNSAKFVTDKGLCNGAMGEVTSFVYAPNNTPPSPSVAFMVKFDNYSGPKFLSTDSIPIVPVIINSSDGENNER